MTYVKGLSDYEDSNMMNRKPKASPTLDKNPYDRRSEKITDKAFKSVTKSVKPVAKDTNKTRRKTTRSRIVGETVPTEKPHSNLKKVMNKLSTKR